jgi:hypothetical protein
LLHWFQTSGDLALWGLAWVSLALGSLGLLGGCGLLRSVLRLPFLSGAKRWKRLALNLLRGICGHLKCIHIPRWDGG